VLHFHIKIMQFIKKTFFHKKEGNVLIKK
jgi:hypothetical protein